MKKLIALYAFAYLLNGYAGEVALQDVTTARTLDISFDEIRARCRPPEADEAIIYYQDFSYDTFTPFTGNHWSTNRTEMAEHFKEIYRGPKRLIGRAYYNREIASFVVPLASDEEEGSPSLCNGACVILPQRYIKSVIFHIEEALKRGLAEFVFFPDMGHNHFFIPENIYNERLSPVEDRHEFYSLLFNEPTLKILYHTAEKLMTKGTEGPLDPLPYRRFRYQTRNLVGDNLELGILEILYEYDEMYNTVRDYKGYHLYYAGMNLSANKNGCFPYRFEGKTYWFDMSLQDNPHNSQNGIDVL